LAGPSKLFFSIFLRTQLFFIIKGKAFYDQLFQRELFLKKLYKKAPSKLLAR
jgi:hypothetical protein